MKLYVNGEEVEFDALDVPIEHLSDRLVVKTPQGAFTAVAVRTGDATLVSFRGKQYKIERRRAGAAHASPTSSGELRAPMPGQIVDVLVEEGALVKKGDRILVLEAMKTQQAFAAPFDGQLIAIRVAKGDQVVDGALLAIVRAEAESL